MISPQLMSFSAVFWSIPARNATHVQKYVCVGAVAFDTLGVDAQEVDALATERILALGVEQLGFALARLLLLRARTCMH